MDQTKTKFSLRIDTGLLQLCDQQIQDGSFRSRTELIEDALRFYLGYLNAKKGEDYLIQSLSSLLTNSLETQDTRTSRMLFRISVELAKLSRVTAAAHDISPQLLDSLQEACIREVRAMGGASPLEDIYQRKKGSAVPPP